MRKLFFLLLFFTAVNPIFCQCSVDLDEDEIAFICYTINGTYGTELAPWASEEPGWSYSWSPSTGLDNPNILHPFANPMATTVYTLTVAAPGCGTFIAGTSKVVVEVNTPSISPTGPLTYYYPFEGSQTVTLTTNAAWPSWYKNGVLMQSPNTPGVVNPQEFTVTLIGANNGTDQYTVYAPYACNRWSDTFSLTYHGCVNDNEFPVPVDQYRCLSEFPISVTQPNMGTGAVYYWGTSVNPSCYAFSNISNIHDNTATFAPVSCSNYAEGIVTRAVATNGEEVRMVIGVGVSLGCRMVPSGSTNSPQQSNATVRANGQAAALSRIRNLKMFPNPASGTATIMAEDGIVEIEVYDTIGQLISKYAANGHTTFLLSTINLRSGTYSCRVKTKNGRANLQLVVIH